MSLNSLCYFSGAFMYFVCLCVCVLQLQYCGLYTSNIIGIIVHRENTYFFFPPIVQTNHIYVYVYCYRLNIELLQNSSTYFNLYYRFYLWLQPMYIMMLPKPTMYKHYCIYVGGVFTLACLFVPFHKKKFREKRKVCFYLLDDGNNNKEQFYYFLLTFVCVCVCDIFVLFLDYKRK